MFNYRVMTPCLDFDVININQLSRLLVLDQSEWFHLESEATFLDVTIPGNTEPFVLNFTKGTNHINNYTLNLISNPCKGCSNTMLDGVYTITLRVCDGEKFSKTKYFLRTFELINLIDSFITHDKIKEQPYKDYTVEILLNIKKAEASLRRNCLTDVITYYMEAKKLADKIIKELNISI
jgi:hypothetical protein